MRRRRYPRPRRIHPLARLANRIVLGDVRVEPGARRLFGRTVEQLGRLLVGRAHRRGLSTAAAQARLPLDGPGRRWCRQWARAKRASPVGYRHTARAGLRLPSVRVFHLPCTCMCISTTPSQAPPPPPLYTAARAPSTPPPPPRCCQRLATCTRGSDAACTEVALASARRARLPPPLSCSRLRATSAALRPLRLGSGATNAAATSTPSPPKKK